MPPRELALRHVVLSVDAASMQDAFETSVWHAEMTVPNPPPAELNSYVVYVGFDPDSMSPAKPKPKSPAAKPKTAERTR